MTVAEARAVADAIQYAHGQCYICVGEIAEALGKSLPEHDWYELVSEAADTPGWVSTATVANP